MDLWIRTQDKKTLMKVNRIEVEENYIVCYEDDNDDLVIYMGEYNSEKRALEVLDEIQEYMIECSFAKITNGLGEDIDLIPNHIFIYQMPKE